MELSKLSNSVRSVSLSMTTYGATVAILATALALVSFAAWVLFPTEPTLGHRSLDSLFAAQTLCAAAALWVFAAVRPKFGYVSHRRVQMVPEIVKVSVLALALTAGAQLSTPAKAQGLGSLNAPTPAGAMRDLSLENAHQLPPRNGRWELLICVSEYDTPEIPGLPGAHNDCPAWKKAGIGPLGIPDDHVVTLSSDGGRFFNTRRATILEKLDAVLDAQPEFLLISISAHGVEIDHHALILPSDVRIGSQDLLKDTGIEVSRIQQRILAANIPNLWLLVDICRTPWKGRGLDDGDLAAAIRKDFSFPVTRDLDRRVPAILAVFAASSDQAAVECPGSTAGAAPLGCFSGTVIDALEGAAADRLGRVTMRQLVDYVLAEVPRRVQRQTGRVQKPEVDWAGFDPRLILFQWLPRLDEPPVLGAATSAGPFLPALPSVPSEVTGALDVLTTHGSARLMVFHDEVILISRDARRRIPTPIRTTSVRSQGAVFTWRVKGANGTTLAFETAIELTPSVFQTLIQEFGRSIGDHQSRQWDMFH